MVGRLDLCILVMLRILPVACLSAPGYGLSASRTSSSRRSSGGSSEECPVGESRCRSGKMGCRGKLFQARPWWRGRPGEEPPAFECDGGRSHLMLEHVGDHEFSPLGEECCIMRGHAVRHRCLGSGGRYVIRSTRVEACSLGCVVD